MALINIQMTATPQQIPPEGFCLLYVDVADGHLKAKFSDGSIIDFLPEYRDHIQYDDFVGPGPHNIPQHNVILVVVGGVPQPKSEYTFENNQLTIPGVTSEKIIAIAV